MSNPIKILAIDQNSSKILGLNIEVDTKEQVKTCYDEFIADVNKVMSKYFIDVMEDELFPLTDLEKQILVELKIDLL